MPANVNKTITMVNIGGEPITVQLGGAPGDGVTEFSIAPGGSQAFHENLCKPVPGAGRNVLPSIMARKSMRTFPDGVRRPVLVPRDEVEKAKADYKRAIDTWVKAGRPAPKPSAPEAPAK